MLDIKSMEVTHGKSALGDFVVMSTPKGGGRVKMSSRCEDEGAPRMCMQ